MNDFTILRFFPNDAPNEKNDDLRFSTARNTIRGSQVTIFDTKQSTDLSLSYPSEIQYLQLLTGLIKPNETVNLTGRKAKG